MLTRTAAAPSATVSYGPHPDQIIDCYPAAEGTAPTVVLIHGGYWRPEYDRSHARSAAVALAEEGFPTALIEYRRIPGDPDAMVADVSAAIRAVAQGSTALPAGRVILVGHSAGGHLALLGAGHPEAQGTLALAPVADLQMAHDLDLDDGAVGEFLGCSAKDRPDLDPARGDVGRTLGPCVVLHGIDDELVPLGVSRSFARAAGVELVELPDAGHFALIDPLSGTWAEVIGQLRAISSATGIE